MSAGEFDRIQNELGQGRVSGDQIVNDMKSVRHTFGSPVSSEFFRSSPPEPASKYYPGLKGTLYMVSYFTRTERGEFSEHITWEITEGKARILNYSGSDIVEWEAKSRARERWMKEKFQNEIRIPFGARFIEINY
jgi:hypothetical protein